MKKYLLCFMFIITFPFFLAFNTKILAADSSSSGGGSRDFGTSTSNEETEKKRLEVLEKERETEYKNNNSKLNRVGSQFNYNQVPQASVDTKIKTSVKTLFSSLLLILQIASVGGVVFAGVRYMFASSEQKADIKSSMIHLVVGMVIVFAASTLVSVIVDIFNEVT